MEKRPLQRFSLSLSICVCLLILLAGCGKPVEDAKPAHSTPTGVNPPATNAAASPAAETEPGPDQKLCFRCGGVGQVSCSAPGCRAGKVDCPGACLKLTRGAWVHMNVAGHDPSEIWQKFPTHDGGYQAWNQHHIGEVIAMQNGDPVNLGACKICGGTTKVECRVCKGTGKQPCEICGGKRFIPNAWTPADNPWLNAQPDLIRLNDGRALLGKIALSSGDDRAIRTRDGKVVHVNVSDIVPGKNSNAASASNASPEAPSRQ